MLPSTATEPTETTNTLTVYVKNIRNGNGRIQLQVYRDQTSFSAETPYKQVYVSKSNVKDNMMVYKFKDLKSGTYGLALLDDENSNKKMDYSWLIPSEGFGFSDYYHTAWSKPKFHQFKFSFTADTQVEMKIRYM
jgi:uncharacterized protein (DUF2141 family)